MFRYKKRIRIYTWSAVPDWWVSQCRTACDTILPSNPGRYIRQVYYQNSEEK
ncbi:hypothetical protein KKJ09_06000 [Xenorhabdus bovienii]|nr:hypothetical protein [Xenorhabdus bovienii]MDE9493160.1 hypothetical protein [Xenorhabdus bovienii]MDE9501696.1 hypothetical protein [Xenorhabdus bovienii]MDE9525912.1 hypothetical protein [Xenorhabdus bovienii]MDE9569223.1 hypothetical protein [Xenorhabdus bovienii]